VRAAYNAAAGIVQVEEPEYVPPKIDKKVVYVSVSPSQVKTGAESITAFSAAVAMTVSILLF